MKKGERVYKEGRIGIVEENSYGDFTDVRWLTPLNVPSCCVGMCYTISLTRVPDYVVPIRKSKSWMDEANAFCTAIQEALMGITYE